MRPDLAALDGAIARGDKLVNASVRQEVAAFKRKVGGQPPPAMVAQVRSNAQGLVIRAIEDRYTSLGVPVDFRVNVNPLVIWLWIGGAIAVAGGLVAIWPAPAARRRRVSDVYAARLARDLGRA
jgi:cytochrome c-type biogenesis protein CcmF